MSTRAASNLGRSITELKNEAYCVLSDRLVGLFDENIDIYGLVDKRELTEQHLASLNRASERLAKPGTGVLWNPHLMREMMAADITERAKLEAEAAAEADRLAGRPTPRTPARMVLELLHVVGAKAEGWLWGVGGTPVKQSFTVLGMDSSNKDDGQSLHEAHAAALRLDWPSVEVAADEAHLNQVGKHIDNERELAAMCTTYERLASDMMDEAQRLVEQSTANPTDRVFRDQAVGGAWGYIAALRSLAYAQTRRAREMLCVQALINAATIESAGWACVLAACRLDCMISMWDVICPLTLTAEHLRKGEHIECGAASFWAACVDASRLEIDRSVSGDDGVLDALLFSSIEVE